MQAIEFISESHDRMISIPESYKDWFKKPVKVILLAMDSSSQNLNLTPNLAQKIPPVIPQEMRVAAAAKWYELGQISQEKAAEIAGLNREEFMITLSSLQVSPFQYTAQELEEDLRDVD
jgi:predicted HTH domain antitoxin